MVMCMEIYSVYLGSFLQVQYVPPTWFVSLAVSVWSVALIRAEHRAEGVPLQPERTTERSAPSTASLSHAWQRFQIRRRPISRPMNDPARLSLQPFAPPSPAATRFTPLRAETSRGAASRALKREYLKSVPKGSVTCADGARVSWRRVFRSIAQGE